MWTKARQGRCRSAERGSSGLEYIGTILLAAVVIGALLVVLTDSRVSARTQTAADCILGSGQCVPGEDGGTDGGEGGGLSAAELRDRVLDPSLSGANRASLLAAYSDDELLALIGVPNLTGTPAEVARMRAALANMIRLSPTLAREVTMLAEWGITIRIVPGDGASTYTAGDSTINLSEGMNGSLGSMTEVLSHEGGHAVWDKSGIGAEVTADLVAQGVDPAVANIINEGFAGIFGNRAYLALHGRDGSGNVDNLAIAHDILGNLANDDTFYADYYDIDTAKARSQWSLISAVLRESLVPGVTSTFGLEDDPDLTRGL